MPAVEPVPPWTTLPWPGAVALALLAGFAAAGVAVVWVVGVAAAVVVVAGACAATVWVVVLLSLPIRTPSSGKIPSNAMAPMAKAGDHWVCCARTGPPAPLRAT